jgi:hypothetical protein
LQTDANTIAVPLHFRYPSLSGNSSNFKIIDLSNLQLSVWWKAEKQWQELKTVDYSKMQWPKLPCGREEDRPWMIGCSMLTFGIGLVILFLRKRRDFEVKKSV